MLLALAHSLAAAENEATKLLVPGAIPVDRGAWEAGLGVEARRATTAFAEDRSAEDRGGTATSRTISANVVVGLVERIDLGLALGWSRVEDQAADPADGSGPTALGLSSTIAVAETGPVVLAIIPAVTIPTDRHPRDDEIPTSETDPVWGIDLAATWNVDRFTANTALGFSQNSGETRDQGNGRWWTGVAAGWTVLDWLQPEADLAFTHDFVTGEAAAWPLTGMVGAQFPTEHWRGSIGIGRTLAGRSVDRDSLLTASFTALF